MSGGGNEKTTTSTEPPSFQKPYLQQGFGEASNLLGNPPDVYAGPRVAPMSEDTVSSFDTGRALSGSLEDIRSMLNQSFSDSMNVDVASNPVYQNALRSIGEQVNTNFGRQRAQIAESFAPGAFGGSDMQIAEGLAAEGASRSLADAGAGLASNFYGANLQARSSVQSNIPGLLLGNRAPYDVLSEVGGRQDLRMQAELEDTIGTFEDFQNAPETALDRFIARIGGNVGNITQSNAPRRSTASSGLLGGLGGAATGFGIGSAIPGATAGSSFGPWGAAIGGMLGLLGGVL